MTEAFGAQRQIEPKGPLVSLMWALWVKLLMMALLGQRGVLGPGCRWAERMWLTEGCQEPQLQASDSTLLPQVNSEYYTGWLDYWGEAHASTSSVRVARGLEDMLQLGANVNMQVLSWQGHSLGGQCPPICQHWSGYFCLLSSHRARAGGGGQGWGAAGRSST